MRNVWAAPRDQDKRAMSLPHISLLELLAHPMRPMGNKQSCLPQELPWSYPTIPLLHDRPPLRMLRKIGTSYNLPHQILSNYVLQVFSFIPSSSHNATLLICCDACAILRMTYERWIIEQI